MPQSVAGSSSRLRTVRSGSPKPTHGPEGLPHVPSGGFEHNCSVNGIRVLLTTRLRSTSGHLLSWYLSKGGGRPIDLNPRPTSTPRPGEQDPWVNTWCLIEYTIPVSGEASRSGCPGINYRQSAVQSFPKSMTFCGSQLQYMQLVRCALCGRYWAKHRRPIGHEPSNERTIRRSKSNPCSWSDAAQYQRWRSYGRYANSTSSSREEIQRATSERTTSWMKARTRLRVRVACFFQFLLAG